MSDDRSVGPDLDPPRPPTPVLRIERLGYADPVVQRLIGEVQAEYVVRYGGPDGAPMEDTMFDPPTGAFYVAFLDDEPVATGAWRTSDAGDAPVETLAETLAGGTAGGLAGQPAEGRGGARVAEIKRMYVRADARRRGLARAVLAHLEATAAEAGVDVMVLETGLQQPEALQLYESAGYVPVTPFGFYKGYPNARHLGKRLVT